MEWPASFLGLSLTPHTEACCRFYLGSSKEVARQQLLSHQELREVGLGKEASTGNSEVASLGRGWLICHRLVDCHVSTGAPPKHRLLSWTCLKNCAQCTTAKKIPRKGGECGQGWGYVVVIGSLFIPTSNAKESVSTAIVIATAACLPVLSSGNVHERIHPS